MSVLDGRTADSDIALLNTTRTRNTNKKESKTFGFRNHSHAIGSTLRHFSTINDLPELPASVSRKKGNMVQLLDWQNKTKRKLPEVMEALKKDPRALEIFMDELALAD